MAQLQSRLGSRFESSAALRQVVLALLALGLGAAGGLLVAASNPVVAFVALLGLVALPWLVTRPMFDLLLVVGTITLLPFAALPVRLAVLTPTLLEVSLLLLYVAWLLRAILDPGEKLARSPIDAWLLLFLGCTLFALVLGLSRDSSTDVIHNYFKLMLAVGVFFAAGNVVRTWQQAATVLRALIVSGAVAAALGVVLWRLPDTLAGSLLTRLSVIGYPTQRVVRYVEDIPALGERAVGTQVDPNSFGGMLVAIAALTGVQMLARRPLLPRWLLAAMLLADLAALVLTQSRAALVGVLAAGALVGTVRYRRLWAWGLVGAILIVALGIGSGYFARLGAGLRFEDRANQMRLDEYRNALDIIARYPAFGVGFGTAGELDLTTGVSSVYLTVAERMGLIGLGLYLLTLCVLLANLLPAVVASRRRAPPPGHEGERVWSVLDSALLGGASAIVGALVVGLVDHYYFNIEFPHMAALFWLLASLALTARRLSAPGQPPQDK
jgi:polysaccharide biosynthesis protein PslJ